MSNVQSIKVVFLGDSGVGKTTIINQYISGDAPDNITPTIGAAFLTKETSIGDKNVELLIWDTAGQELYRGLAPMYYRNASIAYITFDVTKRNTFDSVNYWLNQIKQNSEEDILLVICGNKIDLEEERTVDFEEASKLSESNGAIYQETCGTTGTGVDKLFQVSVTEYLRRIGNPTAELTPVLLSGPKKPRKKEDGGCC